MALQQLYPIPTPGIDLQEDPKRLSSLYSWAGDAEAVAVNLITSVNGSLTGADNTSDTLSNPRDRRLLAEIRRDADLVLVGAATARAEAYTVPRHATLGIVTASGELPGVDVTAGERVVIFTTHTGTLPQLDARARIVPLHGDLLDAGQVIDACRRAGFARILCEGGGRLARAMIATSRVDHVFWSISAQLVDSGIPWVVPGGTAAAHALRLRHLIHDTDSDALYTRWQSTADPGDSAPRR
ncbi:MAG TPA: hypothetical protein GX406_03730 [Pseudoclavibacter sp.]|nr:hypothetical protein [Pseudoclavibacter sp.]